MHSLPSPCSIISTIHFPILLLLLSSLEIYSPEPNNAWQQSFTSSGHHLLVLSPSPHLLTPKGSDKGKPMLTKAIIHLEPVKNDFFFWLRSVYPQSHLKPKNISSLKNVISLWTKRLFAHQHCKCHSEPCTLHMCKSLAKKSVTQPPKKACASLYLAKMTRTRIRKGGNSFLHLMRKEWLGIAWAFRVKTRPKQKALYQLSTVLKESRHCCKMAYPIFPNLKKLFSTSAFNWLLKIHKLTFEAIPKSCFQSLKKCFRPHWFFWQLLTKQLMFLFSW